MIGKFEDLEVWKRASRLTVEIHRIFLKNKNFGFRNQILRSSLSTPSNIAEGYERGSNKDFIRFLNIARGSCGELRTQIYIAIQIDYLKKEKGIELINETKESSAMITGLINKRKSFNKK